MSWNYLNLLQIQDTEVWKSLFYKIQSLHFAKIYLDAAAEMSSLYVTIVLFWYSRRNKNLCTIEGRLFWQLHVKMIFEKSTVLDLYSSMILFYNIGLPVGNTGIWTRIGFFYTLVYVCFYRHWFVHYLNWMWISLFKTPFQLIYNFDRLLQFSLYLSNY